jgi:hypothetical protein
MAFDKDKYWENRKAGKRGQGTIPRPKTVDTDNGAERGFDNDGNIIIKNRAYRRRRIRLPGDNQFTQKTWKGLDGYEGMTKAERKQKRKLGRH